MGCYPFRAKVVDAELHSASPRPLLLHGGQGGCSGEFIKSNLHHGKDDLKKPDDKATKQRQIEVCLQHQQFSLPQSPHPSSHGQSGHHASQQQGNRGALSPRSASSNPYGPLQQTTSTHYPGSGAGATSTSTTGVVTDPLGGTVGSSQQRQQADLQSRNDATTSNQQRGHGAQHGGGGGPSTKAHSPGPQQHLEVAEGPARDASIANAKSEIELPPPLHAENTDTVTASAPLVVLGRYEVVPGRKGLLGEGSFSSVRRAKDLADPSGADVAVKMYKSTSGRDTQQVILKKFKRQVAVMKDLLTPVTRARETERSGHTLAHDAIFKVDPARLFLRLIDYSKDENGEPGADPMDGGQMVVVTEIADFSLKDYLGQLNSSPSSRNIEQPSKQEIKESTSGTSKADSYPIPLETARQIAHNFILACAVLHAKGLVHLDIKPENIMSCAGSWKLIDVDGCIPMGSEISINDSTISFSPCYCSPEWAHFLIEDVDFMRVADQLDVWSVGISLCELIMMDAVLKPKYASIFRQTGSHRKAGFLFLEWLANKEESLNLDRKIADFDSGFADLVLKRMLLKEPKARWSLAECLSHPFLADCSSSGSVLNEGALISKVKATRRERIEDTTRNIAEKPPLIKGVLFKLNSDGDRTVAADWLRRDTWIAHNGNLCYFSQKKAKRLVLLDAATIGRAEITPVPNGTSEAQGQAQGRSPSRTSTSVTPSRAANVGTTSQDLLSTTCGTAVVSLPSSTQEARNCALPWVFQVRIALAEGDGAEEDLQMYACESEESRKGWLKVFRQVQDRAFEHLDTRVMVSQGLIQDFRNFKIQIRNRRGKIDPANETFQSVFRRELWKLNQGGDIQNPDDWLRREMWLAKNGAFCYFSKKENKELQYYTNEDIKSVVCQEVPYPSESCRAHTFTMTLRPADGLEFAPGVFAADSSEIMKTFLGCVRKFQDKVKKREMEKIRKAAAGEPLPVASA
ncbi:unnamed protein product [Amoebophrya sp. A25]|nr:unnamed protein product [Amoebophrya sp. A25]|eukprot:GSA25T00020965001.1